MTINGMIAVLFFLLIALLVYALILVLPASMTMTVVLIIAMAVVGIMIYLVHRRVQRIVAWINGTPGGNPGQGKAGIAGWVAFATFQKGAGAGGGDPDPTKPPPPPGDL